MIDTGILCEASEKGKIVVNICLENGYPVNTLKLEKLLIIMHGLMLSIYDEPFFKQKVIISECGPMIMEVDKDFIKNLFEFKEKLIEYYCLLDREEKVMNYVIKYYANLDAFELNNIEELNSLTRFYKSENLLNVIPNEEIKKVFNNHFFWDSTFVKEEYQKKLKK